MKNRAYYSFLGRLGKLYHSAGVSCLFCERKTAKLCRLLKWATAAKPSYTFVVGVTRSNWNNNMCLIS